MNARVPRLAVTMGDPVGIGPEVILKAATVNDVRATAELLVFGDPSVLDRAASEMGLAATDLNRQAPASFRVEPAGPKVGSDFRWAQPTRQSDQAQLEYVRAAYEAVRDGRADAIVTAPISKAALNRIGAPWPGHTEMLAEWCGVARPLMMLAGPTLKVVPITTHVSLAQVPALITKDLVLHALRLTHRTLKDHFNNHRPRLAVAGLNPHAGEGGLFGREELEHIQPAVAAAKAEGINAFGPVAPDTVFHRAVAGEYDAVLGMYHDQALIPLKLLDFDRAVNVTLGLPMVRTSVDHGTAYDIAGQGVAAASSMIEAIRLAARMVQDGWRARGDGGPPSA